MPLPEHSTILCRVALAIEIVSEILFIVGFSSPYWSTAELSIPVPLSANLGLFKGCNSLQGCTSDGAEDWQKTAAGLEIAGLLLVLISAACMVLYVVVLKTSWVNIFKWVFTGTTILAGTFIICGCIVFGVNKDDGVPGPVGMDIGWAFVLALIGGIGQFVVAGLFIFDSFTK